MRALVLAALVLAATLLVAACSPAGGSATPSSTAAAGSVIATPAASAACIDSGDLADRADVVRNVMQGLIADLKVTDAVKAKADAGSAATGLGKLADFVNAAQPGAAEDFRTAAGEVESAVPQFPDGQALVDKAQADLTTGLTLARAAVCPG
jgi:hypothetical protein